MNDSFKWQGIALTSRRICSCLSEIPKTPSVFPVKHPLSGGDHELLDDTKRKTLRKVVEEDGVKFETQATVPQNLRENQHFSGKMN